MIFFVLYQNLFYFNLLNSKLLYKSEDKAQNILIEKKKLFCPRTGGHEIRKRYPERPKYDT
jgi:hypothetical protein